MAIRLYQREATRRIEERSRTHYQQAPEDPAPVKRLLTATKQIDEWTRIISDLRAGHQRLRALLQELDARKLT